MRCAGSPREFDRDLTIYAAGGPAADLAAPATVSAKPQEEMEYLLEVDLDVEAVEVWKKWRGGREPSIEDRHRAVTYYAANDAYLPA